MTVEHALEAVDLLLAAVYLVDQSSLPVDGVSCGDTSGQLVAVMIHHEDPDGDQALSAGDVLRVQHDACQGYARASSLTLTAFDNGSPRGTVSFSSAGSNEALTGTFMLEAYDEPTADLRRVRLESLEVTRTRTADTNASERLRGGTAERTLEGALYEVTFTGRFDSSRLGGEFGASTQTHFAGVYGSLPTSGELLLTAGSSRVLWRTATDPVVVDYQIDATGSGQYGPALQAPWLSLIEGQLFGVVVHGPPITGFEILPERPSANDALLASIPDIDPDDTRLHLTFEWRRNGVLLPDATSSSLPPGLHRRDDIVELTVTASDGISRVTESASTTIVNAPPGLSSRVITPQPAFTLDDLTFGLATDVDGDEVQVSYEWSRNGTVIDGATSHVLPASEHRRGDLIAVLVLASDGRFEIATQDSVTIQDTPPRIVPSPLPPETLSWGGLAAFDVSVFDPDGDSVAHLTPMLAHGPPGMTLNAEGEVRWTAELPMFGPSLDVSWAISLGDDGDPLAGTITVQDPDRPYPLTRAGRAGPMAEASLLIGDFDNDGAETLLILSASSLYELAHDGAGGYRQVWMYPFAFDTDPSAPSGWFPPTGNTMVTGDSDGDGLHEIFIGASGKVAKLGGAGRRLAGMAALSPDAVCVDLQYGDLDGDGRGEVVCLARGYQPRIYVIDADDLSERWLFEGGEYGNTIVLANVDGDPALEIGTSNGYVLDGATFATEWHDVSPGPGVRRGFGTRVAAGDLDGDGIAEIVAAHVAGDGLGIAAYSALPPQRGQLFRHPLAPSSNQAAVHVADIEGSSAAEILVGDQNWGRLGAFRYEEAWNSLSQIFEIDLQFASAGPIATGDVDGDGELEIVYGSLNIAGRNPDIVLEHSIAEPFPDTAPFVGGRPIRSSATDPMPLFVVASSSGSRLFTLNPESGAITMGSALGANATTRSALTVADWDNDGTTEALLADAESLSGFFTLHDALEDAEEWKSPPLPAGEWGVEVAYADLTGDGRAELIAITNAGMVLVYDVFQQRLHWESEPLGTGRTVLVADLDGDNLPEIIAVTAEGIRAFAHTGGPEVYLATESYSPPADWVVDHAVAADSAAGGALEVFALLGSTFPWIGGTRVQRLDAELAPLGEFPLEWRPRNIAVEPGTPPRNLVIPRIPVGGSSVLIAMDARTGAEVWRSPALAGDPSLGNSIQFIELGGRARISYGAAGAMHLTR